MSAGKNNSAIAVAGIPGILLLLLLFVGVFASVSWLLIYHGTYGIRTRFGSPHFQLLPNPTVLKLFSTPTEHRRFYNLISLTGRAYQPNQL